MSKNEKLKKNSGSAAIILLVFGLLIYAFAALCGFTGLVYVIKACLNGATPIRYDFDMEDYLENPFNEEIPMAVRGICMIVFAIIAVVIGTIFIIIYKNVKSKKKSKSSDFDLEEIFDLDSLDDSSDDEIVTIEEKPVEEKPKERIFCAYCGEELEITDKRCPNCGATKKIKKKVE